MTLVDPQSARAAIGGLMLRYNPAQRRDDDGRWTKTGTAQMDADWASHNASLSTEQRAAVRWYTGDGYSDVNELLRGQADPDSFSPRRYRQIQERTEALRSAMASNPRSVSVARGMSADALGLGPDPTPEAVRELVGRTLVHDGFTSTTADRGLQSVGNVRLEIDVPQGVPSLWLGDNSAKPEEQELLLAPGVRVQVDAVEVGGSAEVPAYTVRGRVVS